METLGQAILWFGQHPDAVTWLIRVGVVVALGVFLPVLAGLLVQAGRDGVRAERLRGMD